MDNDSKIALLRLRLLALEREEQTLGMLEETMELMMSRQGHAQAFQNVRALLADARTAYDEELHARSTKGWFARKSAVSQLRATKASRYAGGHKMANVDLEAVRDAIDAFEAKIGFDREDGALFFNTTVRRLKLRGIPEATVVPPKNPDDHGRVRLGQHIFLNTRLGGLPEAEAQRFHLTILRCLRRIVQTETGQNLLRALDEAASKVKIHYPQTPMLLQINLGKTEKDWACSCNHENEAAALGKPAIKSIPKTRGAKQGTERGTGRGSVAYVKTFPDRTIQIGASNQASKAWIPAHVALFHELTHARRGLTGKQDYTYLSEKPSQLGDTFAHAGAWYTEEEKAAVAAEKEYSEQTGFNLKRLAYGQMAERIDH